MRIRVAVVAGGLALAGMALAGCDANIGLDGATKHSSRGFTAPGDTLTLLVDNDVKVVPGPAGRITVNRWLTGKATQRPVWSLHDKTLTLSAPCTGVNLNCGSRYQVAVPAGTRLRVSTEYGEVSARGLTAGVEVDAHHGDVDLSGVSGPVRVSSAYGEVRGERLGSTDVLARSDNGDIRLAFRTVPKRVTLNSTFGDLSLTVPRSEYRVTTHTKYGDVRSSVADTATSGRQLSASTDNGDVTVHTAG
ncbi:DUF4097 family beta strand repeat-containing protein [Actinocatenispora rupis]|uniref:DUF4097 family beta strand repeat-containing protein n=1 Tax=Actinocatenispora rupis TaxID=519421 RepID=UPI001944C138|nr:DUF4097 family beta strand repeat-containing protein [Actinocatenispora rupis]